MLFRLVCFVSALFFISPVLMSPVSAQTDVIAQRKALMKGVGGATRDPGQMLRGQQGFDLAKVKAALETYAEAASKMPALYPAGSETGGETQAAPAIWQNKADFDAKLHGDSLLSPILAACAAGSCGGGLCPFLGFDGP